MSEVKKVQVEIFGEKFTISGEADEVYIAELARLVDGKMKEVSSGMKNPNPRKVAILAALNIADELMQKPNSGSDPEVAERAKRLISMLDEGIVGDFY